MNVAIQTDAGIMTTPAAFRDVMRCHPSGLVIATTRARCGEPRGFTASSFASISLEPALVLLCLHRAADSHEAFTTASRFAINLLGQGHEDMAMRFGSRNPDKFAGDHFTTGPHDLPMLKDATAWLVCRLHDKHHHADHTIMVGAVESAELGQCADGLVRYRHRFATVAHKEADVD